MNFRAVVAIILVFVGCCSNVVFLEFLVQDEPSSGNIITCAQFIFISLHGIIFTIDFGRKKNIVPLKEYMVLVVLFFIVNLTNNIAFGFKISIPLHIIFRSGGLIASMIMGMIVLGRRYTNMKYISVIMITIGTIICTLASADTIKNKNSPEGEAKEELDLRTWVMGISILTFALFLSARMGIFQECLYTKYGKHPTEALFYIHFLSLPGFLLTGQSIYEHAIKFTNSETLPQLALIPVLSTVPRLWLYLIGNMLTQFICISSVFTLTSECAALTVTLVLTLRKFLSLIFSIVYFENPFTLTHWVGTTLVFGGTLLFSDVISRFRDNTSKKKPD